jgi:DNA-directed RNA polymerase specialized sigma24 family protein
MSEQRVVMRPLDRMSDTELLAALRQGDADALAALCGRHEPALRRYAAQILRARPAIVDDVVQE